MCRGKNRKGNASLWKRCGFSSTTGRQLTLGSWMGGAYWFWNRGFTLLAPANCTPKYTPNVSICSLGESKGLDAYFRCPSPSKDACELRIRNEDGSLAVSPVYRRALLFTCYLLTSKFIGCSFTVGGATEAFRGRSCQSTTALWRATSLSVASLRSVAGPAHHVRTQLLFTRTGHRWNVLCFWPASVQVTDLRAEYQLRLGRQRQVWFIPLADERGVCRWNCEIP